MAKTLADVALYFLNDDKKLKKKEDKKQ